MKFRSLWFVSLLRLSSAALASADDDNDEQGTEPKTTPNSKKESEKKRNALATKFGIENPELIDFREGSTSFQLEFILSDFPTEEMVEYQLFDYDECPQGNIVEKRLKDYPLDLEFRFPENMEQGDGMSHRKIWLEITLNQDTYKRSAMYKRASFMSYDGHLAFCLRTMVYHLPMSNEYSMEVNFRITRVVLDTTAEKTITKVDLDERTIEGIEIKVFGSNGSAEASLTKDDVDQGKLKMREDEEQEKVKEEVAAVTESPSIETDDDTTETEAKEANEETETGDGEEEEKADDKDEL
jgi:hypothetical protein